MSDRSTHVTIEFRHPGFHDDPPGAGELYAAVGRFVRSWSEFEAVLDGLLGIIAAMPEWAEQRRIRQDLVPAPLSKKAEMWRAAFDGIPSLAPARKRALRLMKDALETHDDRTLLLHGRWLRFVKADPPTVEFERRQRKGEKILVYGGAFTADRVRAATAEAQRLTAGLAPLALPIGALPRPPRAAGTP